MGIQKPILILTIICAFSFLTKTKCQENDSLDTETVLHMKLFKEYNNYRKPVHVYNQPVPVSIHLFPLSLLGLDLKSQTLHMAVWMQIVWLDEYLTWNFSEFDNIKSLRLPASQVWIPQVCNLKEISGRRCVTFGSVMNSGSEVGVFFTGHVSLAETYDSTILCKFDVRKYPFDTQRCSFTIVSPDDHSHTLNMMANSSSFQSNFFTSNEEWDLISTSVQEGDDYHSIEMVIILQRRPLFTILTVVLPMIILSVMNTFCYLLPIESGEKIGMSVAIFLTFAVFGSVLSDTMPKNSENISRFTVYVTTQIFLSGVTVVMGTIVLHLFHKNVIIPSPESATITGNNTRYATNESASKKSEKMIDGIHNGLHYLRADQDGKWKTRAKRLDRVLMMINICVNVISFVVCAAVVAS